MELKRTILITGGAGFIGSHVVRLFVTKYPDYRIVNLDKLTYAGNLANLRDIEFNLFEVFGRGEVLGSGPYAEIDAETAQEMLKEVARLAENELAASFVEADRNPPVFDPATHSVTMPAAVKRATTVASKGLA